VRRRETVIRVRWKLKVSERRTCRVLGQPRPTQRYRPSVKELERRLVERMLALVREHPRYGYRMIWGLLQREGWKVNRKRVYRLWRREGLKVPQKARKKRHLGHSDHGCVRQRPEYPDHVWAWDFIFDRTQGGRTLKWLSIVDEYTRECLALVAARSMTAEQVLDVVAELFVVRGVPGYLRSDNGPEFIAKTVQNWLARTGAKTLYIAPGAPWENGYVESFHSRLRDELLNVEEFANVAEARLAAERWQLDYNHRRPHSSLGYQTPAEFASACRKCRSATLRGTCDKPKEEEPLTPILS
jgi:putative transposase